MEKDNYSKLLTERIHDNLNFSSNHRFYLIYGENTNDEFLTRSYYRANLLQTLWATLKTNGFQRVIFYNFADKFFFLDTESIESLKRIGGNAPSDETLSSKNRQTNYGRRQQVGPMGATRNVLIHQTSSVLSGSEVKSYNDENKSSRFTPNKQGIIYMTPEGPSRGAGMSDAAVLTHFNDFIIDDSIRTALVITDLENLSRNEIKRELVTRLQQWGALRTQNRNAIIFITSREPLDESSQQSMKMISGEFPEIANLVNIALGEAKDKTKGYILYVSSPLESEIERWLNEVRLKNRLQVEWRDYPKLSRWFAAENKSLKTLDGNIRQYVEELQNGKTPADEKLSLALTRRRQWVSGDSDSRPALERLHELTGLHEVKEQVQQLFYLLKSQSERHQNNPNARIEPPNLHLTFVGSPGTGKTTVARLIGEIYRDLGLLQRGHTVECRANDLIAGYVGQTAPQTNSKVNEALDGVFFLDEAYSLNDNREGSDFGQAALNIIMARMENERHRLAVILAGYEEEINNLIAMNAGMNSRIGHTIRFEDYSPAELLDIFKKRIEREGFSTSVETLQIMERVFFRIHDRREDKDFFPLDKNGKPTYANARTVREIVEGMIKKQSARLKGRYESELTIEDFPSKYEKFLPVETPVEEISALMSELDSLVGLKPVKDFVHELATEAQLSKLGLSFSSTPQTRHMIFAGSPGTGKSTVARLVGRIYKALGILKKGHFREVKRQDLVAEYEGHTAIKTEKVIKDAFDGVLLIDEAYSLARAGHDPFGMECIDTLVPLLEDNRERLVVIFAGYTDEMKQFIASNSGIQSRIGREIEFPDYNPEELIEIFLRMAERDGFNVPDQVREELYKRFEKLYVSRNHYFGNARDVRVKFYESMLRQFQQRVLAKLRQEGDVSNIPKTFEFIDLSNI